MTADPGGATKGATAEELTRDDGLAWGFMEADTFIGLPKLPLLRAGLGPPPFTVELPDGRQRQVVSLVETPTG